ncbi:hypothetical protein OG909_24680 [Streptomyces sp. NBC_01754]|uniref:hypothetical protein n=1 Tax=Streptomyces sp. NBC_01754 TaxID=2975930 RepID=UPI002DD92C5C|nr:hypothetical protein [Streptomyces sp. NBC_01754]WSC95211.1 hypothetical protein OG909_24680 [Streptomyces sp. NBC_01754]
MAQDSWPSPEHNDRAVTDSEYEVMAGRFSDDGVYGTPSDPPVVTAGTGLTVRIRTDVTASVRGHAWTSGTTGDTLTIAPNGASSTRIDRVILRLDRSDWTVRAAVRQGTAGAAAPPLARDPGDTGLWEILLASVTVPAAATSVTVARSELYVGARIRPALSTTLPLHPELGEMVWETDTNRLRLYDGQRLRTVYEDSGTVLVTAGVSGWSALSDSVLEKHNGTAHLRLGSFERTGGTLSSSTESRLPVLIPAAYRHPTRDQSVLAFVSGAGLARLVLYSANTARPGQLWLNNYERLTKGQSILPQGGTSWVVRD